MKMRMPSSPHSLSVRVAPQAQVVANEEPYRGMNQNTNFVEYDGQLVDEDPAGPDGPPDSRCRPPVSGGRRAR
jgi:hypothetical protein